MLSPQGELSKSQGGGLAGTDEEIEIGLGNAEEKTSKS